MAGCIPFTGSAGTDSKQLLEFKNTRKFSQLVEVVWDETAG